MKNLHVLPTGKPSRLFYSGNNSEPLFSKEPVSFRAFERSPQNIYITDDSEIKDGDYGICLNLVREGFKSHQAVFKMDLEQRQAMEDLGGQKKAEVLKIILTTDQDLIKDGVQAIDDEFLEWFVKNPSCEYVKVRKNPRVNAIVKGIGVKSFNNGYKIIIPKEEPKHETLEEAKQRILDSNYMTKNDADIFEMGVKWQQERMYSEDEVIAFGEFIFKHSLLTHTKGVKSLFEQFKKK